MARQNINLGINENDGTGDKLRDAMRKINQGLIELYGRTGGDATLDITAIRLNGNQISVDDDLILDTNEAGNVIVTSSLKISTDLELSGKIRINTSTNEGTNILLVNGDAKVKNNMTIGDNSDKKLILNSKIENTIIPSQNAVFDIGSESIRYRNLYLSGEALITTLKSSDIQISGGTIDSTTIGGTVPSLGVFSSLRSLGDTFLGSLLIRDNQITNSIANEDIEIRPFGTGNVAIQTRLNVGPAVTNIGSAILQCTDNFNDYLILGVQNLNNGNSASSDIVATSAIGNLDEHYIDMGINSNTYNDPEYYGLHTPNSGYMFVNGGELLIGTQTEHDIVFHQNSTNPESERIRIFAPNGNLLLWTANGSSTRTDPGVKFKVEGDSIIDQDLTVGGNLILQSRTINSAVGDVGDLAGMLAIDNNYIYFCIGNYDGSSAIWQRAPFGSW